MRNARLMTDDGRRITDDGSRIVRPLSRGTRLRFASSSVSRNETPLRFVLCLLLFCSYAAGGELRFRFQPGDKYFLDATVEQKTVQEVNDQQQVLEQTIRFGCDFEIQEVVEAGTAWAKYTYRHIAMKINSPGANMEYDSDANQGKAPLPVLPLQAAIGESLYLKITPQGRIAKINGLQLVTNSAKNKILSVAGRSQVILALQAVDEQFAEFLIKRTLEDRFAIYPEPNFMTSSIATADDNNSATPVDSALKVSVGDTWKRVKPIEESKVIAEWTYRLKERRQVAAKRAIVVIDVNLVIRPAEDAEEVVAGGMKMKRQTSGRGEGQIEIDESTGQIINEKVTQDVVDEIKAFSDGPILRLSPVRKPTYMHIVTTFQMIKSDPNKS